jgi:hypothetical protein
MCRVATEARIFPLLALGAVSSPLVEPLAAEFGGEGFDVSIEVPVGACWLRPAIRS